MARLRLAAVGDNCIDRYRIQGVARVGGNALNVAVHAARAGHRSFYFGAVGDDPDGCWTRAVLQANGVDVAHLQVRPEATAYTDIDHAPGGDRIFAFEEFGACVGYRPTEAETAVLAGMDHVHVGWFKDTDALAGRLRGGRVTLSRDDAVNADGGPLDVVFGSVGEADDQARRALERLLAQGHRLAVVTRGALGSIASDGAETWAAGSPKVAPIDTTGAGDTFIAHFLAAWKAGIAPAEALARAGDAAARTCLHLGGFPQDDRPLSPPDARGLTPPARS
ncbi:MAG: PfkB family carbohydrate kinase [Alphaproteobacteria bacterium]